MNLRVSEMHAVEITDRGDTSAVLFPDVVYSPNKLAC